MAAPQLSPSGIALSGSVQRMCVVCTKAAAKYTCPTCSIPYCSSACYQGHNERCTERFFRKHVNDTLKLDPQKAKARDNTLLALARDAAGLNVSGAAPEGGGSEVADEDADDEEHDEQPLEPEVQARIDELRKLALSTGEGGANSEVFKAVMSDPVLSASFLRSVARGTATATPAAAAAATTAATAANAEGNADTSEGDDAEASVPLSAPLGVWQPWWLAATLSSHLSAAGIGGGGGGGLVIELQTDAATAASTTSTPDGAPPCLYRGSAAASPALPSSSSSSSSAAAAAAAAAAPDRALSALTLPLPPLASLTKAPPSPLLRYCVLDVLLAYAHTLRLYAGDWSSDALGAAGVLMAVSAAVGRDGRPNTGSEACTEALSAIQAPEVRLTTQPDTRMGLQLLMDALALLRYPHFVVDAVADAHACVLAALGAAGTAADRKTLAAAARKLFFFAVWAQEALVSSDEMNQFDRIAEGRQSGRELTAGLRGEVQAVLAECLALQKEAEELSNKMIGADGFQGVQEVQNAGGATTGGGSASAAVASASAFSSGGAASFARLRDNKAARYAGTATSKPA